MIRKLTPALSLLLITAATASPVSAEPLRYNMPDRPSEGGRGVEAVRERGSGPITAQDRSRMNVSAAVAVTMTREGFKADDARVDVSDDGSRVTIAFEVGVEPSNPAQFLKSLQTNLSARNVRSEPTLVLTSADTKITRTLTSSPGGSVRIEGRNFQGVRIEERSNARDAARPAAATPKEQAKQIIISHLQQIKSDGKMSNAVATVNYWKGVFDAAKRPDLLEAAAPLLKTAISAGIKPLQDKGSVTAPEFADLAIASLGGVPAAVSDAPTIPRSPSAAPGDGSAAPAVTKVVALDKLPASTRQQAQNFGEKTLATFAVALFNQRGVSPALEAVTKSAIVAKNPAIARGFERLVTLSADPVKNADTIRETAGALNSNLHAVGLHVEVDVIEDGSGQGRAMLVAYQITGVQAVPAIGHTNDTLEISKIGETNLYGGTLGHHREGDKQNFLNGPSTDEHSASIFSGLTQGQPILFSIPTNTGRQPLPGFSLTPAAKRQVAAADTAVRAAVPATTLPAFQTLYRDSVRKHEAFHGSFEVKGGRAAVKIEAERILAGGIDSPLAPFLRAFAQENGKEAAINVYAGIKDEQGAYLHQIANSDPKLAPVLVAELVNRSLGGGGTTTTLGTRLALISLVSQLPNAPALVGKGADPARFINDLKPENFQAFFKQVDAKTLQTAATNAVRDDLLKPYLR